MLNENDSSSDVTFDHLAWLHTFLSQVQTDRAQLLQREYLWGWARRFTFFSAISAWYPFRQHSLVGIGISAALFVVFRYCVLVHRHARADRELSDQLVIQTQESQRRCRGEIELIRDWQRPADDATGYELSPVLDDGHTWHLTEQELGDVDAFAQPVGFFGLLNRASTCLGARRLRDMLEHPCLDLDRIQGRQQAISWLEKNSAMRLRVMAACAILRGHNRSLTILVRAIAEAKPLPRQATVTGLRLWSIVSLAVAILSMIQVSLGHMAWFYGMIALALVNGVLYLPMRAMLCKRLDDFKEVALAANGLLRVVGQGCTDLPDQTILQDIKHALSDVQGKAVLPAFCNRIRWSESGGIFHEICNFVFFYDLHVASSILNCVVPNQQRLLTAIAAMADLESLASLSSFAFESRATGDTCYPTITDEPSLSIVEGRHPLIPSSEGVANSIELDCDNRVWVITGSNMAGKSTLLRMCGMHTVLAQLGTVALAERMSLSPVCLMSDMRVSDNLADHESYFLAEVRQIRRMVKPEVDDYMLLGLIDEPYRGTNSSEQIAASLAVVEHFIESGHFFLVATHEQQLTDLASNNAESSNFHFQENLGANGMVFDYRLHAGPATTRNALLVLEREGYPQTLLDRARAWIAENAEEIVSAADEESKPHIPAQP